MRKNDNRVKMLYHMENEVLYKGARFSSKEQLQSYVDFITGSTFWQARIEQFDLPGAVTVYSYGDNEFSEVRRPNEIWLTVNHWNQQVVLHELAHFFVDDHPPEYVRVYLELIEAFMGAEIARQYRQAFRIVKVKF